MLDCEQHIFRLNKEAEMPSKTTDVATNFVDLVLRYKKQWNEIQTLSEDEVQILFDTVSAAGFDPVSVVPGKLVGHYRDQDGSRTGDTFPINSLCPFEVVVPKVEDHYFATGWLDCALRRVIYGVTSQSESRGELIEKIAREIERSVPLEPIPLTPEGDLLRESSPGIRGFGLRYFIKHTRDENSLGSCVGVHKYCDGWMDRKRATKTHDAIVCRECHLRVLFPKEVETYGDLRRELAVSHTQVPT